MAYADFRRGRPNIKLVIAYDGRNYLGWQNTKEGPSIEAALQKALEHIYQEPIRLQAASRTDAGVHAAGQTVNYFTGKERPSIERLPISLNALLSKEIAVLSAEIAAPSFHPTLDCRSKEYHYYLCFGKAQLPHLRFYSWHYPGILDIDAMQEAAAMMTGTRDYSAFCNVKKNTTFSSTVRRIDSILIEELEGSRLRFRVKGTRFLYKMVRNLVGTLTYIGKGKIPPANLDAILESLDRKQAGMTAPAHGLFLHRVYY